MKQYLYQLYKKQETKEHRLNYLFLELTQRCNLNCLHCGSDCKKSVAKAELNTESWIKLINYIASEFSSKVNLVFTGGEPLLHPKLDEITAAAKQNNMPWGMVTNGIALTESKLNILKGNNISSLTLSVDGVGEPHDFLRNRKGAFEKIDSIIEMLATSKLKYFDVVTCVYPKNLNQLTDIADYLVSKGVKRWRLFRVFPLGRAAKNNDLKLSFAQTQEMLKWISDNKKTYARQGLNINLSCEGWLPWKQDKAVRDVPFFCRSGINFASILSDGTITGCSNNHESFYMGNVLKDDFRNVWENHFDDLRKKPWLSETVCSKCEHFKKCEGGSIHLWEKGAKAPKFCYVKDL